jgi:hypothetical protein
MVTGMAEVGKRHDEPLHEEYIRTPSPGHCGRDLTWGGSTPADGMMVLMDRTPPGQVGRFLDHVAVCWACFSRVASCSSPRGANVLLLGC